ncbi:hypothetical protein DVH05_025982 [Phytophthora capsici]|nr:hypothetical protein DVH05_025982 [Phytophthora capsici]
MCGFSSSNGLPRSPPPESVDDILAALDVLALLMEEVYQPYVGQVVTAARKFFLRQKTFRTATDPETLADLVFWIDERFEKVRPFIVMRSTDRCGNIQNEFNVAHESYVQVHNVIRECQLSTLQVQHSGSGAQSFRNSQSGGVCTTQGVKRVPDRIRNALPSENGKKLCMRFLSNQGCRSRGSQCAYSYRGDFRPQHLPGEVKVFISANYGGLKPKFQDL